MSKMLIVLPSPSLRRFVDFYWLSLNNTDAVYSILPDGSVDMVVRQDSDGFEAMLYGSSTFSSDVSLLQKSHYLGIRFKPGQSRYFIRIAASELTDLSIPSETLTNFQLTGLLNAEFDSSIFSKLDRVLEGRLFSCQPNMTWVDHAVSLIETHQGAVKIGEVAESCGKSRRQLERAFTETVGISPKFFSSIVRFQRACHLLNMCPSSLADIALSSGYFDQSHMNHEFKRLTNLTPTEYVSRHVAFIQDASSYFHENKYFAINR